MTKALLYARPAKQMGRRRTQTLGLGLLFAVTATVPMFASEPAHAQQPSSSGSAQYPPCTKTVTQQDSDNAHTKYLAGKLDYDEGNYDSALRRFKDAYNLDCTKHELLIIISAAHERKGDKKEALGALELYVNRAPTAPDVGTYQAKIENLRKQVQTAPPPTATPTTGPTSAPPGGEMQEHTIYPWITVGAGVAALGVGLVLIFTAPSLPEGCSEATQKCQRGTNESDTSFNDKQSQAGRSVDQPKWGIAVSAVGGVLIVGGLLWHFLEPTGPKEAPSGKTKIRPTPLVGSGFAGLSLGGTF